MVVGRGVERGPTSHPCRSVASLYASVLLVEQVFNLRLMGESGGGR